MVLKKSYLILIPILMMLTTPIASVYSATISPLPNASVDVTGDNGEGFFFTGADGTFVITQDSGLAPTPWKYLTPVTSQPR